MGSPFPSGPGTTNDGATNPVHRIDISVRHPDYSEQLDDWIMMSDLAAGSRRVKQRREVYLPPTELEWREGVEDVIAGPRGKKSRYTARLERSVFVNGVDRLTKYAMSNLFRKDALYPFEKLPEKLKEAFLNCDMLGTPFPQMVRNVATSSYQMGHYFVLIDMPKTDNISNLKQEQEANIRPYLVSVDPQDVLDWDISRDISGEYKFSYLVHRMNVWKSDGPMRAYMPYQHVKVWEPKMWHLYEVNQKGEAHLLESGENSLGEVPFVPIYSEIIRPMVSRPPLLEAAFLNIAHYQAYSAFNNGLMIHLNPILVFTGVAEEDEVKLNAAISALLPVNADAKYVEFNGTSLSIAKESAKVIADEMLESGLRSNSFLGANTSAEARRLARSDYNAWLESVATSFEHGFSEVVRIMGKWLGEELSPEQCKVNFNRDFDVVVMDANLATFFLNARRTGEISRRRFFEEMDRGEVIRQGLDLEKEIADAKADAVDTGAMHAAVATATGGISDGQGADIAGIAVDAAGQVGTGATAAGSRQGGATGTGGTPISPGDTRNLDPPRTG